MTFQPVVPIGGVSGWRFLERTAAAQRAAFEKSPEIQRDVAYFIENISSVESAEDLVADRRLLKVALGAFGMESEIDKRAFLRKVLEEGTAAEGALANRLTDPAWRKFSAAFGFGSADGTQTARAGFAGEIAAAYKIRAFEASVGDADESMRLAMTFRREMATMSTDGEFGASWFLALGSKPLRAVFEKAYGLPTAFGQLDIDRQREILRDKTSTKFGADSLAAFRDEGAVEALIDSFLARAQTEQGVPAKAGAATALALLQNLTAGSGIANLFASLS